MSIETEHTTAPADLARRSRVILLFVRMWAVAHLLHLLIANHNALDTPWNVAVVLLAVGVLLRPGLPGLFAGLMVSQLVEYVVEMPLSPDHWALVSFVNLAVLLTMLRRRSAEIAVVEQAFPAARLILLVAYGAAALSKWNTSFLDPVTSCANAIAKVVSFGAVGPLGDSALLGWGAACTETSVFVLLLFSRTRPWGVLLGLAFHFSLSASPVMAVGDFTSTVYALFLLFLAPEHTVRVLERIDRWGSRSAIVRDATRHPRVTAAMAVVGLGFGGYLQPTVAYAPMYVAAQAYFLAFLLAAAVTVRSAGSGARIGPLTLVQVPVVLLAVLWALNPYLGLRTTGSFTMFSNLRTESPAPNHLFMPSWRLTDWQDEMVLLRSSNDPQLQTGADSGLSVPLVALRRIAGEQPGLVVTGELDGRVTTWGPGPDQEQLEPLPAWIAKVFLLRPVMASDEPFCSPS